MRKTDRRIGKTKKAIYEALLELLQDHKISEITIVELCEKADVNRKTFYNHYSDIYEVESEIEDEVVNSVIQYLNVEFQNEKTIEEVDVSQVLEHFKRIIYPFTKGLITFIHDHPEMINIRINCGAHSDLLEKLVSREKEFLEDLLGDQALDSIWLDYYLTFIVDGMNMVITNWENSHYPVEPDQLARFFTALLAGDGVNHFVKKMSEE